MSAKLNLLIAGLLSVAAHHELNRANAQTVEYAVVDLGTLGGNYSVAYDINYNGHVVGYATTKQGLNDYRAFLYANGRMQDLGTLGGEKSRARGINDHGQVVGDAEITLTILNYYHPYHAFLYSNGSMQDLGTFGGDRYHSIAYDINNSGQVIGFSQINSMPVLERAFLYSDGVMKELKILLSLPGSGFESRALDINDNAQVTGNAQLTSWDPRTFLYFADSMQDLGAIKGTRSTGFGINNNGQVVGSSVFNSDTDHRHAFFYSDGVMYDLGTLDKNIWNLESEAFGINDNGLIVGRAQVNLVGYRAFLYSNGVMRDLNDLIDSTSGWTLLEAKAINNAGQIACNAMHTSGQQRAVLLNPLPLGWKRAIESQPAQPTYGECPEKLNGKDSLVVVTHGWQPAWEPVDVSWVDDIVEQINRYLTTAGLNNWKAVAHKWIERARPLDPLSIALPLHAAETALKNGIEVGHNLGKCFASQRWSHIHFIGHSAGSALVQAATDAIKDHANGSSTTVVHETFLDAFVGSDYEGIGWYGRNANWTDNYFSHDILTGGEAWPFTEGPFDNAYNIDVTWIDNNRRGGVAYFSTPSGLRSCPQGISAHHWPVDFYLNTIPPNTQPNSYGFGFPLSKEGGNWDFALANLPPGRSSFRVLEPPSGTCSQQLYQTTPAVIGQTADFLSLPSLQSSTGVIQKDSGGIRLTTDSPAWLATFITLTSTVNTVSFDAQFVSTNGAPGLLSVYWDTNVVGALDERAVQPGLQNYQFKFSSAMTNSTHSLGFRLDSFTNVQSSAIVTNVAFGFAGVRDPFSLSLTTNISDSLPVFQLTGQTGFTYTVEASTDLVNWDAVALLVNTNGAVRFVDQTATNAPARFYRALAPY